MLATAFFLIVSLAFPTRFWTVTNRKSSFLCPCTSWMWRNLRCTLLSAYLAGPVFVEVFHLLLLQAYTPVSVVLVSVISAAVVTFKAIFWVTRVFSACYFKAFGTAALQSKSESPLLDQLEAMINTFSGINKKMKLNNSTFIKNAFSNETNNKLWSCEQH